MAAFYSCLKGNNDYIMATGPSDVRHVPEGEETSEECAGKKKSKFKTFKKFFAKKKRKDPPASSRDSNLKPSQSSSDVSIPGPTIVVSHSTSELGAKGSMGNKALSHESVFISEPTSENVTVKRLSQENLPGKVKTLQLQLESNIRIGSPPQIITSKTCDDAGAVSEDDGLPQSPPEMSTLHDILTRLPSKSFKPVEHRSSLSLGGTDSEEEQISSESSSRPISPLSSSVLAVANPASPVSSLLPVDFSTPASTLGCLDNSAARHKIALNPRKHRDQSRRRKLTSEPLAAREQLQRVSEEENSTEQLIEAAPHDSEGSAVQEEVNKKTGNAEDAEKANVTKHPEHESQTSTEVADNVVMLNNSSLEDSDLVVAKSGTVSNPKVVCNLEYKQPEDSVVEGKIEQKNIVYCPSGDSLTESETSRHCTVSDIIELSETPENLTEETKCQDEMGSSVVLNRIYEQMEYINVTAAIDTREHLLEMGDQTENETLVGYVPSVTNELLPIADEISLITSETSLSLNVEQVQLPGSRASPEMEGMYKCEAEQQFVPETTTETTDDQEASAEENQLLLIDEEPQISLQKCSNVDGSDLNTLSLQQPIDKPDDFKAEKCSEDTLSKTLDESDIFLVNDVNQSSANDPDAYPIAVTNAVKDQMATSCSKTKKTSKATDESLKSQQKSTKPVRFTIAPAWQRSLSSGSSAKEETNVVNISPSTIKSELFEGTIEEAAHIDVVKPQSTVSCFDDADSGNAETPHSHKKNNESGSHDTDIPFGVRLKRTSPFLKYDDKISNLQKSDSCSKQTSCLAKDLQKPDGTEKPSQVTSGITKPSTKQHDIQGEKHTRPEEVPKKQCTSKSSEKILNKSVSTVSSEPEWISMAKIKQKVFQGHPLAREQNSAEKAVKGINTEEVINYASEESLRKSSVISHVDQEKTSQPNVLTNTAVTGHGSLVTAQSPVSEKGTRQSDNLSASQQNPDEPPWLSLAKKKAKAWSEMPQIVQ